MLNAYHTVDGIFHQSTILINGKPLVRMTVEKSHRRDATRWEWLVWSERGVLPHQSFDEHGNAPTLKAAKLQALDAVIEFVSAAMTDDGGSDDPLPVRYDPVYRRSSVAPSFTGGSAPA